MNCCVICFICKYKKKDICKYEVMHQNGEHQLLQPCNKLLVHLKKKDNNNDETTTTEQQKRSQTGTNILKISKENSVYDCMFTNIPTVYRLLSCCRRTHSLLSPLDSLGQLLSFQSQNVTFQFAGQFGGQFGGQELNFKQTVT